MACCVCWELWSLRIRMPVFCWLRLLMALRKRPGCVYLFVVRCADEDAGGLVCFRSPFNGSRWVPPCRPSPCGCCCWAIPLRGVLRGRWGYVRARRRRHARCVSRLACPFSAFHFLSLSKIVLRQEFRRRVFRISPLKLEMDVACCLQDDQDLFFGFIFLVEFAIDCFFIGAQTL